MSSQAQDSAKEAPSSKSPRTGVQTKPSQKLSKLRVDLSRALECWPMLAPWQNSGEKTPKACSPWVVAAFALLERSEQRRPTSWVLFLKLTGPAAHAHRAPRRNVAFHPGKEHETPKHIDPHHLSPCLSFFRSLFAPAPAFQSPARFPPSAPSRHLKLGNSGLRTRKWNDCEPICLPQDRSLRATLTALCALKGRRPNRPAKMTKHQKISNQLGLPTG